jgi:hypothetical protein
MPVHTQNFHLLHDAIHPRKQPESGRPAHHKGEMMDGVRGHEIARWSDGSHMEGRNAVSMFLHAASNTSERKLYSNFSEML